MHDGHGNRCLLTAAHTVAGSWSTALIIASGPAWTFLRHVPSIPPTSPGARSRHTRSQGRTSPDFRAPHMAAINPRIAPTMAG